MQARTDLHCGTPGVAAMLLLAVSGLLGSAAFAEHGAEAGSDALRVLGSEVDRARFDCGARSSMSWLEAVRVAVARGEIADPESREIPLIPPGPGRSGSGSPPCLAPTQILPYEDRDQILLSDYSPGQLIDLMVSAANELMATHGDIFDFVGYWLNFVPHHQYGTAAYVGLENDVTGIGDELFNLREALGVGGQHTEGFLIFWDINRQDIQPGSGPEAFLARVALGHEFEHRFAVFLPDLLDGRQMQGYGGFGCYTEGHWNPAVDSQGSVMGIGEWVGSDPATLAASYPDFYLFNADTGSLYSYTELYLMGYVSPAEMDAGNSELRYMDSWDCESLEYFGSISAFAAADLVAAAGPRVPDSSTEDKHYRTGWIMIHQPGDPPHAFELTKAAAILEQQQLDWEQATLGRGTMNNARFDDCDCDGVPDAGCELLFADGFESGDTSGWSSTVP